MELSQDQIALLQAIQLLQNELNDHLPSTVDVGQRLLAIYKERGGPYFWAAQAPWHGTNPMARELEDAGLIKVHSGVAQYVEPGTPTPTPDRYFLSLTDQGDQAITDQMN
ncbi:hypothetical protein ABTW72_30115 [Micromonospora sp. NPDC127501]|uniref:hypothetical protein n=1 Tax=Micromonospora sp. NPDC127501 TaxID=3154872 RepID=UPI00331CE312